MTWIIVAAAGLAIGLAVAFWKDIVTWANQRLATWLGEYVGEDVKETFLLLLAGLDRSVILTQRMVADIQARLLKAQILFRRILGTQDHQKVVKATIQRENGDIIELEAAEVIPWHELPDEVREKFIRRQASTVELELKLEE